MTRVSIAPSLLPRPHPAGLFYPRAELIVGISDNWQAEPCPQNPRPLPRQRRPPTRGRLAVWVVVGKLARALAGPFDEKGAVHKAVEASDFGRREFVGKAGAGSGFF